MGLPPFEILPGGSDHLVNPFPSCSKGAELFQRIEPFLATLNLIRQTPSKMGSVIKELHSFSLEELLGNSIAKVDMADAVKAGLFLAVDAWDEAHGIAQDLDTVEGSYCGMVLSIDVNQMRPIPSIGSDESVTIRSFNS